MLKELDTISQFGPQERQNKKPKQQKGHLLEGGWTQLSMQSTETEIAWLIPQMPSTVRPMPAQNWEVENSVRFSTQVAGIQVHINRKLGPRAELD